MKDRKTCVGHLDKEEKEELGFGGSQEGSGRPKNPRVIDSLRDRVEQMTNDIVQVYVDAAQATLTVMKVHQGEIKVVEVPDHAMRLKAVEALNDRVYGKPKQVSEITGPEGGPIEHVGIPDSNEFKIATAKILEEADAITEAAAS